MVLANIKKFVRILAEQFSADPNGSDTFRLPYLHFVAFEKRVRSQKSNFYCVTFGDNTYMYPENPWKWSMEDQGKFHNFRVYASAVLFIEFIIVLCGVRFVQMFGPISLACVLLSVLSLYIGSFLTDTSVKVCLLGNRLLRADFITVDGVLQCNKTILEAKYCTGNGTAMCDDYFKANTLSTKSAFPGYASGVIKENLYSHYMNNKETVKGVIGMPLRDVSQNLQTTFALLLSIYFPSVTGIMTGSNMSGDLEDPQKSIPKGTLAAQLFTSFIYLSFTVMFAGTIAPEVLRDKYGESLNTGGMVTSGLTWPNVPILIAVGSFTSTFGAALQSLCSAPRLLSSIASDEVIPFLRIFGVLTSCGEPVRALLITTLFSEIAILLGDIDKIAPVVNFFFLMCYAFVNIACALQTLLKSPNWRPRFRFYHWTLSLVGAFLSIFIMFFTNWIPALIVIFLCACIYKYVEYLGARKEWGDGIRGLHMSGAKLCLLRAETEDDTHTKNWRPQILLMTRDTDSHLSKVPKMLAFIGQLKSGGGLVMSTTFIMGNYTDKALRDSVKIKDNKMKSAMKTIKVKGFVQSVICQDIVEGITSLIQCTGIGVLRPNTIVVGWPYQWKDEPDTSSYFDFIDAIHRIAASKMCIIVPKGVVSYPERSVSGTIDIWWIMHDGGLLVLLPFLLKKHPVWRRCLLRVFAVATENENNIEMKKRLNNWMYQLRIPAEISVVDLPYEDVTPFAHEKTIQMENRAKFLKQCHVDYSTAAFEPGEVLKKLDDVSRIYTKGETRRSSKASLNFNDNQYANIIPRRRCVWTDKDDSSSNDESEDVSSFEPANFRESHNSERKLSAKCSECGSVVGKQGRKAPFVEENDLEDSANLLKKVHNAIRINKVGGQLNS